MPCHLCDGTRVTTPAVATVPSERVSQKGDAVTWGCGEEVADGQEGQGHAGNDTWVSSRSLEVTEVTELPRVGGVPLHRAAGQEGAVLLGHCLHGAGQVTAPPAVTRHRCPPRTTVTLTGRLECCAVTF